MVERKIDTRARNFATVVYPESAPEGWQSMLAEECIPAFISPLHDNDVNPTGEPKKPHYHVLLMFDGKKSVEQVESVFKKITGVGCEKVKSMRGYARYLCHMDNPDKYQYNPDDVVAIAGADYVATVGLPTDKYKSIAEMIEFCQNNDIVSYAELLEFCMVNKMDWFRVLCDSGTFVIKEYLKSKSWQSRMEDYNDAKQNC